METKEARRFLLCILIFALVVIASGVVSVAAVPQEDVSQSKSPEFAKTVYVTQGDMMIIAGIIVVVVVCCGLVSFFFILLTCLIGRGQLKKAESMGIRSDELITTLIIWFFLRNLGIHRLYWGMSKLLPFLRIWKA